MSQSIVKVKCPSCGAITSGTVCEYCGSPLTSQKSTRSVCARCGSQNIVFRRENQGEVRGKNAKRIVHRTVGFCKDCGNTWYITEDAPKKRKTWLWVLGWIFIFPLPLTILLLRKKSMKPVIKYGIIAAAWIVFLLIWFSGNTSDNNTQTPVAITNPAAQSVQTSTTPIKEPLSFVLSYNETGEYGVQNTLNENTDMPDSYVAFHIPVRTYEVTNKDSSGSAQVSVYSGTEYDGQWEQFVTRCCDAPIVLMAGETKNLTIHEGQFVKLSDNSTNIEFVASAEIETWEQEFAKTKSIVLDYADNTIAPEYEKRIPTTIDYHVNQYGVYTVYLELILPESSGETVRTAMKLIEDRAAQSPYEMDIYLVFYKSSNEGLCSTAVGNGFSGYSVVVDGKKHEYTTIDEIPDDLF